MLLPIIMIVVCVLLGGGTLLFLKFSEKRKKAKGRDKEELAQMTANEFVNVKDIRGSFLYTRDGMALAYLKIFPISTELFSKNEKRLISKQLTASLSSGQYPFQLLAVSRPVDISPLMAELSSTLTSSSDIKQKELLKHEIVEMGGFALSGEVVRTVTELALRHRYLILKVPFGGEELCRRLRREYGVSIVLNPETEREPVSVHIAFDPTEAQGGGFLPLYDESLPMPRLLLPPEVEARLPEGLDRGQLLSVLWRTGALRPGQVSVQLEETENKGAVPEIRAFCP